MSSRLRSGSKRTQLDINTSTSTTKSTRRPKKAAASSQSTKQRQKDDSFGDSTSSALSASNITSLASSASYPKITTMFSKKTPLTVHEIMIEDQKDESENLPNSSSRLPLATPASAHEYHPCDEAVADEESTLLEAQGPTLNFGNDESTLTSLPPTIDADPFTEASTAQAVETATPTLLLEDTSQEQEKTPKRSMRDLPSRSTRTRPSTAKPTSPTQKKATEKKAAPKPVKRKETVTIVIDSPSPPSIKKPRPLTSPKPKRLTSPRPSSARTKISSMPSLIDLMEVMDATVPSKLPSPSRKEEIADLKPLDHTNIIKNPSESNTEVQEKDIKIPSNQSLSSPPSLASHPSTHLVRIARNLEGPLPPLESIESDVEGLLASQEKKFNSLFTRFKLTGRCLSSYSANVDRLVNSLSIPICPATSTGAPQAQPAFPSAPPALPIGPVTPISHPKAKSFNLDDISPVNLSSKLSSETGKRNGKRNRVAWCPSPSSTADTSLTLEFGADPTQIIGKEAIGEDVIESAKKSKRTKFAECDLVTRHTRHSFSNSQNDASLSLTPTPTQLLTPTQRASATQILTPTQPMRSTSPSSGPSSPTQLVLNHNIVTPQGIEPRANRTRSIPKSALLADDNDDGTEEGSTQRYVSHEATQIMGVKMDEDESRVKKMQLPSSRRETTESERTSRAKMISFIERAITLSEWISSIQPALFSALIDMHWTSHFTLDHDGNMDSSLCINPTEVASIMDEAQREAKALRWLKIALVEKFIKFNFSSSFISLQLHSLRNLTSDDLSRLEVLRSKVDMVLVGEITGETSVSPFKLLLSFLYITETLLNTLESAERHIMKTATWTEGEARTNIKSFLLPELLRSLPSSRDIPSLNS